MKRVNCEGAGDNDGFFEVSAGKPSKGSNEGVIITAFILHMQNKGIWPCRVFIGDDPKELTPEEVFELKNEFKAMLPGNLTPHRG